MIAGCLRVILIGVGPRAGINVLCFFAGHPVNTNCVLSMIFWKFKFKF